MNKPECIFQEISKMIISGALTQGQRLDSIAAAGNKYGVSPATVAAAYHKLESAGLIKTIRYVGYFVQSPVGMAQSAGDSAAIRDLIAQHDHKQFYKHQVLAHVCNLASPFPHSTLFPIDKISSYKVKSKQFHPQDTFSGGNELLRQAISHWYFRQDIPVALDEIVITNGASEALTLGLKSVQRPGARVMILSPCFYGIRERIESMGMTPLEIPIGKYGVLPIEAISAAIAEQDIAAVWMMSDFINPTGECIWDSQRETLVALLHSKTIPLIVDDVYHDLYYNTEPLCLKRYDKQGLVLHCGSFSKSLAPGARIGWIAPGRFYEKVLDEKLSNSLQSPIVYQVAIADYLTAGKYQTFTAELRAILADRMFSFIAALESTFGSQLDLTMPKGGYFLWIKLGEQAHPILEKLYHRGYLLAPGQLFSPELAHYARINISIKECADISKFADTLKWAMMD